MNVDSTSIYYNKVYQDGNYFYDAVGNITTIRDDAQQAIFYSNSLVSPDQSYTYDSLYRLVKAEGREDIGLAAAASPDSWADSDKVDSTVLPSNTTAVQRYIQKYQLSCWVPPLAATATLTAMTQGATYILCRTCTEWITMR